MSGLFITGTDTDCGKTFVSCAMLRQLRRQGVDAVGMKPVASGALSTPAGLRNADAEALIEAAGSVVPYGMINPYVFEPAIAPHLAAAQAGVTIDGRVILDAYGQLKARHAMVLVEGVGGWRVPLAEGLDVAGLSLAMQLPVVLVVGMRLGCINHALLTAESILACGAQLAGWVANQVDPDMACFDENLHTLRQKLPSSCLGVQRYQKEVVAVDDEISAPLFDLCSHHGN